VIDDETKLSPVHTQAGWLQRLVLAQIRVHRATPGGLPTSVRFVYYELKDRLPTRATVRLWSTDISEALMVLRETGLVRWDEIRDETKGLRMWRSASSVYTYALESIALARLDPWRGHPPLIITESRSLQGVLDDLAKEYLARIITTGGQAGGVLHTDCIPTLIEQPGPVVYLGDLNLAGEAIEANARRVIEGETGPLQWERLLLTEAQVDTYGLPMKETLDRRFRDGGRVEASWEAEALGQTRIQDMLRAWLDARLPEPLERVRVREARQRRAVARRLAKPTPTRRRRPR
jgi:hypothetical protein